MVSMCVFVLLCVISLHANGSVIQYDDGHWEYQNPPLGGQAVYFTVPTEYGPAWNLETLSILTSGDPGAGKPVTVTVWEDNAGSMGIGLFFSWSHGSPGNYWHWCDFDVSSGNLQFLAGESFFAGFDQDTQLYGCWDSTDPDHNRGYLRLIWDTTWQREVSDAMIRASGNGRACPGALGACAGIGRGSGAGSCKGQGHSAEGALTPVADPGFGCSRT